MSYQLAYSVRVLTVTTNKLTQLLRVVLFCLTRTRTIWLSLRYRHVVTLRRVCVPIICFWLTGISIAYLKNFSVFVHVVVGLVALSAVISIFSYTRIFFKLRQQQAQVQDGHQGQPNGERIPLNIARYKKTVCSIAWVQLALVACYVLFIIFLC